MMKRVMRGTILAQGAKQGAPLSIPKPVTRDQASADHGPQRTRI